MRFYFGKVIKIRNLFYFIVGLLVIILFSFLTHISNNYISSDNLNKNEVDEKTDKYLQNLDIDRFERQGTDVFNPKYSPLRLGKPLEEIDVVYDYDFDKLLKVEKQLEGVDRKKVLKHIFNKVTQGARNNTEKHIALLKFLQKSSLHNYLQPTYPNKQPVYDPLVLLELAEMRCGHVARLAVDLFASAGFKGRLVQAGYHVLAEIFYDNQYHYFEADIFSGGETVIQNGMIPSVEELSHKPFLIDSLGSYQNMQIQWGKKVKRKSIYDYSTRAYPSFFYFYKTSYDNVAPSYYEKTATQKEEENHWYGWNYYKTVLDEKRIIINKYPIYYVPEAVNFKNIEIKTVNKNVLFKQNKNLIIEWNSSEDKDNDVIGYKIYVSKKQRGWTYNNWNGDSKIEKFWNNIGGWKPEMYENLFKEPHSEIALIKTQKTKIDVLLESNNQYYITVMPYDSHGESVGRKIYPMSNEIKINL